MDTANPREIGIWLRALAQAGVGRAVGVDGAAATAFRRLGLTRLRQGHLAAARDLCAYACFLDPADPRHWDAMAAVRLTAGDAEGAAAALQSALALESNDVRRRGLERLVGFDGSVESVGGEGREVG